MSHGAGKTRRQKHRDLFDPKSQHYKSHTKNVIGWQERERWEIGSEGEQRTRDVWKSSACLFILGASSKEWFHSLPFFFSLESYSNTFGVHLDKNHPKSPLSSHFNDDFYFSKTLNDKGSVRLLMKYFFWRTTDNVLRSTSKPKAFHIRNSLNSNISFLLQNYSALDSFPLR